MSYKLVSAVFGHMAVFKYRIVSILNHVNFGSKQAFISIAPGIQLIPDLSKWIHGRRSLTYNFNISALDSDTYSITTKARPIHSSSIIRLL